jgi:glycosyltransferase involved in cell wall biosynthesis
MINADQVSCVIPYAGAEKYIGEAVGSAVAQGFGEVIIVNDGFDPVQLAAFARAPRIRLVNLAKPVGCPNARNLGIKACHTPYVVMLDHDDLLCAGYFHAMSAWLEKHQLRCAAGTLRYIGENSRRVGAIVSRDADFFMPSGFIAEATLLAEAGYFPDSYSDDLLFFRAVRKATRLTTCPDAGVLYRIHPQAESSRNTKAWWAFNQLLTYYDNGSRTLPELNAIAKEFARSGTIPPGMEAQLCGEESAVARFLARSTYACWLNRDLPGLAKYGFRVFRHVPELVRLARKKWSNRGV